MAISTLSKFGVVIPGETSNQGLLMPKLGYRFRVLFQNFGISKPTTELTKQVMSVGRPTVDHEEITLHAYNSKIKLAGRYSWQDIDVAIRDDATGAVSKLVGEQVQKQFDFFEQASAASGIDYKFGTVIEILDGGNGAFEPTVLESFELVGCFIQKTAYLGADYSKSEPLTITLTLRYDNAIQVNTTGTPVGIGTNVGRTIRTLSTG